ncbi:MAG: translation initiation factor IF-2 [Opitutales bacterium]
MSVRIYELSKKIGMENKQLIELLLDRGYEVKTASSTVDTITAEALTEEFAPKKEPEPAPEPPKQEPEPEAPKAAPKRPPAGAMVRSAADIEREKQEKEAAARAEQEAQLQAKRDEREKARAVNQPVGGAKPAPAAPAQPLRKAPPSPPPMSLARKAAPPTPPRAPAPGTGPAPRVPAGVVRQQPAKGGPAAAPSPAPGGAERVAKKAPDGGPKTPPAVVRPAPGAPAPAAPEISRPERAAPKPPAEDPSKAAPTPPTVKQGPAAPPVGDKPAEEKPAAKAAPAAPAVPQTPPAAPSVPPPAGAGEAPKAPAIPPRKAATAVAPPKDGPEAPTGGRELPEGARIEEKEDGTTILHIKPPVVVRDFAQILGLKPFQLNAELMEFDIFAGTNSAIDVEVATKLAARRGLTLEIHHRGEEKQQQGPKKPKTPEIDEDDPSLLVTRPPVVCVLGHVDHGKTTLLDTIRKTQVTKGEAGGITQHTAAYQVIHNNHKISFIDTPGHAAFSGMRERGAKVTDIAILVVAADDGFMPQTDEALKFAQKNNVPIVVAVNKMDARGADVNKVYSQMQQRGIAPEDLGGEVLTQPISALKGDKIEDLLEQILLQAEIMELKANPKANPVGTILESQIEQGRGCTTTVIIEKGTLKIGQALLCGQHYCKVRALLDENNKPIKSAGPGDPVRIVGWSGPPDSGSRFRTVKNEKEAKREAETYLADLKRVESDVQAEDLPDTVEELLAAIDAQQQKVFRMILKSDVYGTVEALRRSFEEFETDKVKLELVNSGVGQVTKSDVMLASSTGSTIVCFNVKTENGVPQIAKREGVRIMTHDIIYRLIDDVKEAMAELLDPEYREVKIGGAEVRAVFPVSRGNAAGCMITDGLVKRDAYARVLRGDTVVHDGRIGGLRRFKETVNEVRAGYECGIQVTGCNDYQEGDTIEVYEIHEHRPSL